MQVGGSNGWQGGGRPALLSTGPFAAVIALTHRIQWFDKGEAPKCRSTTMRGLSSIMHTRPADLRRCCLLASLDFLGGPPWLSPELV
jgi:hypothetical protein